MRETRILIVDDEENMRHMISELLKREGYRVDTAGNGQEALDKMEVREYELVLCDVRMPQMDGLTFLKHVIEKEVGTAVVMMSAYSTVDVAVEAMQLGAVDYISKPFNADEILLKLKRHDEQERMKREYIQLKKELQSEHQFGNLIGQSDEMKEVFRTVQKVAGYKTTVLITGESGTGKELLARAIHYNSPRGSKSFVAINCGAIPENLLESELFGYRKGAFTDAVRSKKGLFEEAHEGSLFLDEIGELPLMLQVKLLRALQEEEIRRIGDNQDIKVDARIVAATVHDLSKKVEDGSFRSDLYYRLNVLTLNVPPLRERRGDIPLLINHFLHQFNKKLGTEVEEISPEAYQILLDYQWPGNVRELENILERAMILSSDDTINEETLPPELRKASQAAAAPPAPENLSLKKAGRALEVELIKRALKTTDGNHTHAAKLLEISHRTLLYKLKEYNLR
jgi:two-component system response regulator AtoC